MAAELDAKSPLEIMDYVSVWCWKWIWLHAGVYSGRVHIEEAGI